MAADRAGWPVGLSVLQNRFAILPRPVREHPDWFIERATESGQLVLDPGWRLGVHAPLDESIRLQLPQRLRQHLARDTTDQIDQRSVPDRGVMEREQRHRRPLIRQDLDRRPSRAVSEEHGPSSRRHLRKVPKGTHRLRNVADMQLGVFSLTDMTGGISPAQRVRDIVEYGAHADEFGLDVYGVGEHHTVRFAVPSPAVVLAAIASRSNKLTLTSAVSVLSVLDPVRLFQDFAQLDLVSGGRAEITVGRSAYSEPFNLFGVQLVEYDGVFEEKLDLLLQLRSSQGELTWAGKYRAPLDRATITPQLSRPLPVRVGVGGTPESAERAGALGLPMTLALLGGDPTRMRPVVDRYRAAATGNHVRSDRLGVAGVSHFFVGATSQSARDTFYPAYRTYFREGRNLQLDRATFDEMAAPNGPLVVGSPQEVIDKILRQNEALTLDRFLGQVDLGGLPREDVLASIDRFADGVAPALRAATQY